MSQHDEKNRYEQELEEEFSLEEILAEYGSSREQKLMRDVEKLAEIPAEPPAAPPAEGSAPAEELPPEEPLPKPTMEESEELTLEAILAGLSPEVLSEEEPPSEPVQGEPAACEDSEEPEERMPEELTAELTMEESEAFEEPEEPEELGEPEVPGVPSPPRPISLEEVVGSTVEAVLEEEQSEPILKPRRSLFSRRKLEETERLYPEEEEPVEIEPIGPELEPMEAAEEYRRACRRTQKPLTMSFLLALIPAGLMVAESFGLTIPYWSENRQLQSGILLGCIAVTALLCREVFVRSVSMLGRKRFTSECMVATAALVSMADCVACLMMEGRSPVPPYGAACCMALVLAQWGIYREYRGMYDTFRMVAMDENPPYLVTDTERGACKQRGSVPGFYTAAMKDHLSGLWQTALLPVVFVASLVFAGLSSLGQGRGGDFLLNWSILLAAGGTCALPLCWSLPFSVLAKHLQKLGCAVAGWFGAEKLSCRRAMILTDADLFPPGTVQLNGIKIYGEERSKVIAYAATMVRQAGSGLERLFDGLIRSEGFRYEEVDDFSFYEEGGWSATIHGETALMGTASFLRKMGVRLPGDVHLRTGLYLAVDRQLVAIFAVKYNPAENVDFALRMMRRSRITPILASRDPNITPGLLKRKFHKGVKVEYPDLTNRVAFSEMEEDRDLPRALLFREGLLPYAEAVTGSRRLCQAVRRAVAIGLIGSVLGMLLVFYLAFQGAYQVMTPLALEVFLLLWILPPILLADWTGRS